MARIRTVKPEFWTSEQVVECSPTARLLFIGLWNFCDDAGNHPYALKTIKMEVFPGDDITTEQIENLLSELIKTGLIKTYTVDNKQYFSVTGWHHQKIDKPNYKHPHPLKFDDQSASDPLPVAESSPPEGKGKESKGKEGKGKQKTSIPENFEISERVRIWASDKGHTNLEQHLESFKLKCRAKGYAYVNWDDAFMNAIRDNWAKIGSDNTGQPPRASPSSVVSCPKCGQRVMRGDLTETGCIKCMMDEQ